MSKCVDIKKTRKDIILRSLLEKKIIRLHRAFNYSLTPNEMSWAEDEEGIYLGVRTCELFLCFVAIVRVGVYYVDFFVLRHWWVSQVLTPRQSPKKPSESKCKGR